MFDFVGGRTRARTWDPLIKSQRDRSGKAFARLVCSRKWVFEHLNEAYVRRFKTKLTVHRLEWFADADVIEITVRERRSIA